MSRRRTSTSRRLVLRAADRWLLVAVTAVYIAMVVLSGLASSDGYWLGFANGLGFVVMGSVMASCWSSPVRYLRSTSTAAVRLPGQRTAAMEQSSRVGAVDEDEHRDGHLARSSQRPEA